MGGRSKTGQNWGNGHGWEKVPPPKMETEIKTGKASQKQTKNIVWVLVFKSETISCLRRDNLGVIVV